jgi:hypothetical protein
MVRYATPYDGHEPYGVLGRCIEKTLLKECCQVIGAGVLDGSVQIPARGERYQSGLLKLNQGLLLCRKGIFCILKCLYSILKGLVSILRGL